MFQLYNPGAPWSVCRARLLTALSGRISHSGWQQRRLYDRPVHKCFSRLHRQSSLEQRQLEQPVTGVTLPASCCPASCYPPFLSPFSGSITVGFVVCGHIETWFLKFVACQAVAPVLLCVQWHCWKQKHIDSVDEIPVNSKSMGSWVTSHVNVAPMVDVFIGSRVNPKTKHRSHLYNMGSEHDGMCRLSCSLTFSMLDMLCF